MKSETIEQLSIDDVLNAKKTNGEEVQTIKTATKRAGRPRKSTERASERVVIYFTPSQLEEIETHCHRTKQKVGTFIKDVFTSNFGGEKKKGREIDKFIDRLGEEEIGKVFKDFLKSR